MAISSGVAKRVAYKKETSFGVLPGPTTAKVLRRVTSDFNLTKEVYESSEIRQDYQVAVMNHGVRSASGSINGELSPGTYTDFIGSVIAKDFTTGAALTGLSITIAASGSLFTVARASGSWLTDNIKVGDIAALTAGTFNAANLNNNLLVVAVTALTLTVKVLSTTSLVAEGPIASTAFTVRGKKSEVPLTGHTNQSYAIEEWYSDIAQSEVFGGMKVSDVAVSLPSTGFATIDLTFSGKDLTSKGTSAYYTSPASASTTGVVAAVNGAVIVNGLPVAVITDASFTIARAIESGTVVGSNSVVDLFTGNITASGSLSVYFENAAFRDFFDNETEVSVVLAMTTSGDKAADGVSFCMPRVKFSDFSKSESQTNVTASSNFTALLNTITTAGLPATTISVQDTAA